MLVLNVKSLEKCWWKGGGGVEVAIKSILAKSVFKT